jgi:hypothetical protein
MKIFAFAYQIKKEQEVIANACLSLLGIKDLYVMNIPNYKVEDFIEDNVIVITFGRNAGNFTASYLTENSRITNVKHIILPAFSQLEKKEENKTCRENTFQKLKELKEFIEQDRFQPVVKVIAEGDLPNLDRKHLLLLKEITEEAGETSCFQVNKNGKLIEISLKPIENSKADIHLTFSEIYTIRALMDTLQVKAVNFVVSTNPSILRSDLSNNKKIS